MAKQTVDIGSSANDGTGDSIRNGGDKINDNLVIVLLAGGVGNRLRKQTSKQLINYDN